MPSPHIESPLFLDIILCKSESKISRNNVRLQRLVRLGRQGNYSHVAIMRGIDVFDATPQHGAQGESLLTFFDQYDSWCVYRNIDIETECRLDATRLFTRANEAASKFEDRGYNYWFLVPTVLSRLRRKEPDMFCSQLAYNILKELGVRVGINHLFCSTVLPVDFERAFNREDGAWRDVTDIYKKFLNNPKVRSIFAEMSIIHRGAENQLKETRIKGVRLEIIRHFPTVPTPAGRGRGVADFAAAAAGRCSPGISGPAV